MFVPRLLATILLLISLAMLVPIVSAVIAIRGCSRPRGEMAGAPAHPGHRGGHDLDADAKDDPDAAFTSRRSRSG
jgi:hypothetical protein